MKKNKQLTKFQQMEGKFADLKIVKLRGYYGIMEDESGSQFVVDCYAKFPKQASNNLEVIAKRNRMKLIGVYAYN